jgi:hypothetical protein
MNQEVQQPAPGPGPAVDAVHMNTTGNLPPVLERDPRAWTAGRVVMGLVMACAWILSGLAAMGILTISQGVHRTMQHLDAELPRVTLWTVQLGAAVSRFMPFIFGGLVVLAVVLLLVMRGRAWLGLLVASHLMLLVAVLLGFTLAVPWVQVSEPPFGLPKSSSSEGGTKPSGAADRNAKGAGESPAPAAKGGKQGG